MRRWIFTSVCVVLVILASGTLHAGLVNVENIQLTLGSPTFYQGGSPGNFQLNSVGIVANNGLLWVGGAAGYGITGTITVTPSALVNDNSSGGIASGDFAGGSILAINGDLVDLSDLSVKASGSLLVAVMDAGTWVLEEWLPQDVRGNTNFTVSGGLLSTGVDIGGGDTLVINDFQAVFSFVTGFGPFGVDPADFGATSYTGVISNVQITPIPEPSTLTLLSLAGIAALRRRSKRN